VLSTYNLITLFILLLPFAYHFIPSLAKYKCTQPFYFPLSYKPAAQKVKMDCNSLMRSSRLCATPVAVPVALWSVSLFCYARESS
jgi:hypothetical protein